MRKRVGMIKKLFAVLLSICLVVGGVELPALAASDVNYTTVADPGTAYTYEKMMGTDADGNRYAGRVWVDKSVYANGDTMKLSTGNELTVNALDEDEEFLVVFSALGSSTVVSTEMIGSGKLDVVLVMDISASMGRYIDTNKTTRLEAVTEAANGLIDNILSSDANRVAVVTYGVGSDTLMDLGYHKAVGTKDILTLTDVDGSKPNTDSSGGVKVEDGDVTITATTNLIPNGNTHDCYYRGTNLQAGIEEGMAILANQTAADVEGRTPVVIVLTDGVADYAVNDNWWTVTQNTRYPLSSAPTNSVMPSSNTITPGVALSTLLNASYMKSAINNTYANDAVVYGVSVDLEEDSDAYVVMNPKDAFNNNTGSSSVARTAYGKYSSWASTSNTVTISRNEDGYNYSWTFDQLPASTGDSYNVTKAQVTSNINYVDTHYNVDSAELSETFETIYNEIKGKVFNPISSSSSSSVTDEIHPLIFVDNIGDFMEVKDIRYISLFGKTYSVDFTTGTDVVTQEKHGYEVTGKKYSVSSTESLTGTNPTTGEAWNINDDIEIILVENLVAAGGAKDGTQSIFIRIHQEILPIILDEIESTINADGTTESVLDVFSYNPLRVFYTVGMVEEVLDAHGNVDLAKVAAKDSKYIQDHTGADGKVYFYSNEFNRLNEVVSGTNVVADSKGDAHVGFVAAADNRYYFHQTNYPIYDTVTDPTTSKNLTANDLEEGEFGVAYIEDGKVVKDYQRNNLTLAEVNAMTDASDVFSYVTYYHPDTSNTAVSNAATEVTYLVFSSYGELKSSIVFGYEKADGTISYLNYDGTTITEGTTGNVVENMASYISAVSTYISGKVAEDKVYAYIAVGSQRVSRLHNMTVDKITGEGTQLVDNNLTDTAELSYAPEYTLDADLHEGSNVVVWLGNNGRLAVQGTSGIELSKAVTGTIDNVSSFEFTISVNQSIAENAISIVDTETGEAVAFTVNNNVITVSLAAGQTVRISGIPAGAEATITEKAGATYTLTGITGGTENGNSTTVTIPAASAQTPYVPVTFTNAPNGDLTIVKDVAHNFTSAADLAKLAKKEFTFEVNLGSALANKSFSVDRTNASQVKTDTLTANASGIITVQLKDNESVTLLDLPVGTSYTVTEVNNPAGYVQSTPASGNAVTGTIVTNGDHDAHFVNTYSTTPKSFDFYVSVTKTVEGDGHPTETFNFKVQKWNGTEYVDLSAANETYGKASIEIDKADTTGDYKISLDQEEFKEVGTYYYRIVEVAGSTPGMEYDTSYGRFRVVVTDKDLDGQLEAVLEAYSGTAWASVANNGGVKKDFTNKYTTEAASTTIPVKKTLTNDTGVEVGLDTFQFKVEQVVSETNFNPHESRYSATTYTGAGGEYTFQIEGLDQDGTYYYVVSEIKGDLEEKGMSYDSSRYLVTVTVTTDTTIGARVATRTIRKINADGSLATETNDVAEFKNTYDLGKVDIKIPISKVVDGDTDKERTFEFTIYETNSSFVIANKTPDKKTITTTKDGSVKFVDNVSKAGIYYYSIKEVGGSLGGVTYDTTHYHVTVTVTADTENGVLKVTNTDINKIGTNSDTSGNVVFVNSYKATPVSHTIEASKELTGRALRAGEFTFELYEVTNGVETLLEKVSNSYHKNFSFSERTYTETGVYEYKVVESKDKDTEDDGLTYSNEVYKVVVTVTDDGEGALKKDVEIKKGTETVNNITFTNTYVPVSTEATISGKKILEGAELKAGDFQFALYETDYDFKVDAEATLVTGTPVANGEDGTFTITVPYEKADTHFYVLQEVNGGQHRIVYDETEYHFRVKVVDNSYGQLIATVERHGMHASDEIVFTNATYDEVVEKDVFYTSDPATSIDGRKVKAGEELTYVISYTNYTGAVADVIIGDKIPEYTTYVENSAGNNATYHETTRELVWMIQDVAPLTTVEVSFKVTVDEVGNTIENQAHVNDGSHTYYTNEVINYTKDEDIVEKEVFRSGDLTANIDGQTVKIGDELVYKITYKNTTDETLTVEIEDTIPEHTLYVKDSADNGGKYVNGKLTWTKEVVARSSWTVSFKVKVDEAGDEVTNQAVVVEGENTYTTNKVVNKGIPELKIQKLQRVGILGKDSIEKQKVAEGDIVVYSIVVTNVGNATATDLVITDEIPEGLLLVDNGITADGKEKDGVITWTIDKLEAGKSVTVRVAVKVPSVQKDTEYKNIATVVYENNPIGSDKPQESNEVIATNKLVAPQMGDNTNVTMWSTTAAISLALCIMIFMNKKKREV